MTQVTREALSREALVEREATRLELLRKIKELIPSAQWNHPTSATALADLAKAYALLTSK